MNNVVQQCNPWDRDKNPHYLSPEDRITNVINSLEGIQARIEKGNQCINLVRDLLIDYVCQEGLVKNEKFPEEVDVIIKLINLVVSDNNHNCDMLADNKKELSFVAERVETMNESKGLNHERP